MGVLSSLRQSLLNTLQIRRSKKRDDNPNHRGLKPKRPILTLPRRNRWSRGMFVSIHPLPWDLVLEILDHVDDASVVCFMLTCHGFYEGLKHRIPRLTQGPKLGEFLLLLDRDSPETVLCTLCMKLVRWDRKWNPAAVFERRTCTKCHDGADAWVGLALMQNSNPTANVGRFGTPGRRLLNDLHFFPATVSFPLSSSLLGPAQWNLTCTAAYLIMRAHLRGPRWGLPIHPFNWEEEYSRLWPADVVIARRGPWKVKTARSQELRIIKSELYIKRRLELRTWPKMWHAICKGHLGLVCTHLRTASIGVEIWQVSTEKRRLGTTVLARSCRKCRTDYTVAVGPKDGDGMLKCEVIIYLHLGACQTPLEWEWSAWAPLHGRPEEVKAALGSTENRVGRYGIEDFGSVYRRMMEAEGRPVRNKMKFLGLRTAPWGATFASED